MTNFNFKKCQICHKPFSSYGGNICSECLDVIDNSFITIRDYLYDNPERIGIEQLSKKTEVSEEIILLLISQGRIVVDGYETKPFKCSSCGGVVNPGVSMCDDCKQSLSKQLAGTLPVPEKPAPTFSKRSKMHIDHVDDSGR